MNNEAGGATFFFDLPLGLESGEVICQPKPYINELITPDVDHEINAPETLDFSTQNYTVLLVDDNHNLNRFPLQRIEILIQSNLYST